MLVPKPGKLPQLSPPRRWKTTLQNVLEYAACEGRELGGSSRHLQAEAPDHVQPFRVCEQVAKHLRTHGTSGIRRVRASSRDSMRCGSRRRHVDASLDSAAGLHQLQATCSEGLTSTPLFVWPNPLPCGLACLLCEGGAKML